MKKVSIIMVLNNEIPSKEELNSIFGQTYKNYELIVISDGLTDNKLTEMKKMMESNKNVVFIQNKNKEGLAESLNIGIKHAKGDYIARVGFDYVSKKDRIAKQVQYLDSHPDIGMCGIKTSVSDTLAKEENIDISLFAKHAIFFYNPFISSTIMFRKKIIEKFNVLYNKKYENNFDYDFAIQFSNVSNISYIDNLNLFEFKFDSHNTISSDSFVMEYLFNTFLNLEFTKKEIDLLNPNIGLNPYNNQDVIRKYIELDILLKRILVSSYYNDNYDVDIMFLVLKEIFNKAKEVIINKNLIQDSRVEFYLNVSIFNYESFSQNFVKKEKFKSPEISILLPVYNSENYIMDSLLSALNQSFQNFEILVMYEYGITDDTLKYINVINDSRIKVIKNNERLGLAASLNKGIEVAKGKYIARLDSDDLAAPDRLLKQYNLLEKNSNIDICSTWQQHFGANNFWVHETPKEDSKIKALLLFECCLCHSTVMFRREKFVENNLFYRTDIRQEDFELWCRASKYCNFYVIPEILGYYRLHDSNITFNDLSGVIKSQIEIVKNNLKVLDINTDKYRDEVYVGFKYLYDDVSGLKEEAFELFEDIIKSNNKLKIYDKKSLMYALEKRRNWINKSYLTGNNLSIKKVIKNKIKKILYPIYKRFKHRMIVICQDLIDQNNYNYSLNTVDERVRELEKKEKELAKRINEIEKLYCDCYNKYNSNEKVKIVFLMHAASFWPSFESVYNILINDGRFDFKIFVSPDVSKESSQFSSCEKFLKDNNILYEELTMQRLVEFSPHVIIMQTPYDKWHRNKEFYSENLKKLGIRLVYIPYGIEFSTLPVSIDLQFGSDFINNMWRVYTINQYTKEKYCLYSKLTSTHVKEVGSPKFDGLMNKISTLNIDFKTFAKGRKIVLVKIHFPFVKIVNNKDVMYTPNLDVYINLLNNREKFKDFYFIFMMHPKMFDNMNIDRIGELKEKLEKTKDIYVYNEDDYRGPLYQADYYICDRSAVSIELGYFNKPVLFLESKDNKEEYLDCFERLFDTYIKGINYDDIEIFLNKTRNKDKINRQDIYNDINYINDGKAGKRIADDIYNSIYAEREDE